MFELSLSSLGLLALAFYVAYSIVSAIIDPLSEIPGPLLARFTRLWYFFEVYKGSFEISNLKLHKKYGPIVRIAPNEYSIDDVEAAKAIYRIGNGFVKAPWYWAWMPPIPERANLFADMDPHHHASQRRKFASAYTMTSLVEYESSVNESTAILAQRFSELAASGHTINFGHWLQYYAFDTISLITFGTRFGFLDKGEDENRLFEAIDHHNAYSSLVGIFPFLHRFLFPALLKTGGYGTLLNFSMKQIERRRELLKEPVMSGHKGPQDFMARFLAAHETTPETMTNDDIFTISITNIAAGSDTTAVTLSAALYYLLKNPSSYKRLQQEIDSASAEGIIDDPITFRQSFRLPYLQAVLKEALRLHPATGLGLQRCVPATGTILSERNFPGGTTVGINSWVAHRNVSMYGQDASKWRPERWLEIEADGRDAEVKQYFFAFGMGSRTCIGKNISLLELNKLIPQLLRRFDLVLDDELSKHEWKTLNRWFVKPQNFKGRIISRATKSNIGSNF